MQTLAIIRVPVVQFDSNGKPYSVPGLLFLNQINCVIPESTDAVGNPAAKAANDTGLHLVGADRQTPMHKTDTAGSAVSLTGRSMVIMAGGVNLVVDMEPVALLALAGIKIKE